MSEQTSNMPQQNASMEFKSQTLTKCLNSLLIATFSFGSRC